MFLKKENILPPFIVLSIVIIAGFSNGNTSVIKRISDHLSTHSASPAQPDQNVYEKLKEGKDVRLLVIGDSIGASSGVSSDEYRWFNGLTATLSKEYGSEFNISKVTTGGATVFGGWTDYHNKLNKDSKPDFVFICFGQNDQGVIEISEFGKIYENLIRSINADFNSPEIIAIIESSITNEQYPETIRKIADYYRLTVADTREMFKESGYTYNELTKDGVHPNDLGYQIYSEGILSLINNNLSYGKETVKKSDLEILYPDGAKYHTSYYRSLNTTKDQLTGTFEGNVFGLDVNRTPTSGSIRILIDGVEVGEVNLNYKSAYRKVEMVASHLSSEKHTYSIVTVKQGDISINGIVTNQEET